MNFKQSNNDNKKGDREPCRKKRSFPLFVFLFLSLPTGVCDCPGASHTAPHTQRAAMQATIEGIVRQAYAAFAAMVVQSRTVATDPAAPTTPAPTDTLVCSPLALLLLLALHCTVRTLVCVTTLEGGAEQFHVRLARVLQTQPDIEQPLYVSTHYFGPTGGGSSDEDARRAARACPGYSNSTAAAAGTLGLVLERWVVRFDRHEDQTIPTLASAAEAFRRDVALLLRVLLVKLRLVPLQRLVLALRKNVASSARLDIDCATDSASHGPFLGEEYKLQTLGSVRSRYGVLSVFALYRDDLAPLLAEAALSLQSSAIIHDYEPADHASSGASSGVVSPCTEGAGGGAKPVTVPVPGAGAGGIGTGSHQSWQSPVFGSLAGSLRSAPTLIVMPKPPLVPASYHSVQPQNGCLYVVGRKGTSKQQSPLPPLSFAPPAHDTAAAAGLLKSPTHTRSNSNSSSSGGGNNSTAASTTAASSSSSGNSGGGNNRDTSASAVEEEESSSRPRFVGSVPVDKVPFLSMYAPVAAAGATAGAEAALGGMEESDSDAFDGIFSPCDTPDLQHMTDEEARAMDAGDYLKCVSRAAELHAFQHCSSVPAARYRQSVASAKDSIAKLVRDLYNVQPGHEPPPPLPPAPLPPTATPTV